MMKMKRAASAAGWLTVMWTMIVYLHLWVWVSVYVDGVTIMHCWPMLVIKVADILQGSVMT